jgi:hypothetical protein
VPESAHSFEIQITCIGVPDAWAHAPVPFQILGPRGAPKMVIWYLVDGKPYLHEVTGPGAYTVRAELPSGAWVSETVVVPQGDDSPDSRVGKGTLDFHGLYPTAVSPSGEYVLNKDLRGEQARSVPKPGHKQSLPEMAGEAITRRIRYVGQGVGNMVTRSLIAMGGQFAPKLDIGDLAQRVLRDSSREFDDEIQREVESTPDSSASSKVDCLAGFFEHWQDSRTAQDRAADVVLLRPNSAAHVPLTSLITTDNHPGWNENAKLWRPLVVVANVDQGKLIVWPPTPDARSLEIESKQVEASQSDTDAKAAAVMSASLRTNSSLVNALYAYTRNNAIECARHVAPPMIDQAEELLRGKLVDPLQATVAAYALLKINEMKKKDWLKNLADGFKHLPDGAILYGTYLIRSGAAPQAANYFLTALQRGIPMYTEGLQLLRDGLNFVSGLNPSDLKLQMAANRANRLFFAGQLNSQLTCLDLGDSLKVQFYRLLG